MTDLASCQLQNALYRLEKYGELKLDGDGYFRVAGSYWSLEPKKVRQLVALGLCRIDVVGDSTFAVAVRP